MSTGAFTNQPGTRFALDQINPEGSSFEGMDKDEGREQLKKNRDHLQELQEQLYAQGKKALLIVLQAMDTAGKDGTIEHVCGAFNPQGTRVTSFKAPSKLELSHDFLWRIHQAVPRRGQVGIFNRSHYEDVLVVRVKELAPPEVWRRRYDHINNFERLLWENGVKIVKIYLHIDPKEQASRLVSRKTTPRKHWKFNPGDLEDRALWPRFMSAYADALTRCNTDYAPWHVVPANRKWYRNLVVSNILIEALESLDLSFPDPVPNLDSYSVADVDWP